MRLSRTQRHVPNFLLWFISKIKSGYYRLRRMAVKKRGGLVFTLGFAVASCDALRLRLHSRTKSKDFFTDSLAC